MNRCSGLRCGALRTTSHPGMRRLQTSAWSSASQTGSVGRPAPSSETNDSRASRGHGSGIGADSAASRSTVWGARRTPAWAAAAAARSTSTGSRSGSRVQGENRFVVLDDDALGERGALGPCPQPPERAGVASRRARPGAR